MAKVNGRFSTVIRASIREQFFNEPNKGKLINDLLILHYMDRYFDLPPKETVDQEN